MGRNKLGVEYHPKPWIELWDLLSEKTINSLMELFRCALKKNTQTNGWTSVFPTRPPPTVPVRVRSGGEQLWGTESSNEGICQTSSWQLQTMCLCLQGSALLFSVFSFAAGIVGIVEKQRRLVACWREGFSGFSPKERIFCLDDLRSL